MSRIPSYLFSSSYFVEYRFPLPSLSNDTGKALPAEATRVVSNKVVGGGELFLFMFVFHWLLPDWSEHNILVQSIISHLSSVVRFQHRSVFSVHLSGPAIKQWWDTDFTFTVLLRKSHQKKVNLAVVFQCIEISAGPLEDLSPNTPLLL